MLDCESDLTCLFTMLRQFYKGQTKKHKRSPILRIKTRPIEYMVANELKANTETNVSSQEIITAIRVLLRARPRRSTENARKRILKDERKEKFRWMKAPHEILSMLNQSETMTNLNMNIEEENLQNFLSNSANLYLINHFDKSSDQIDERIKRAIEIISELALE